jgi:hypothetical protein
MKEIRVSKGSITQLLGIADDLQVSIFTKTHLHAPQNAGDKTAAENLIRTAKLQLTESHGLDANSSLVAKLDGALAEVDWNHTKHGLAIYVSDSVSMIFSLTHEPEPRVEISNKFALTELIRELKASQQINVLLLSELPTKLFSGPTSELTEIKNEYFPMVHDGPGGLEGLPTDFGQQTSIVRDENHKQFFRKIEQGVIDHLKLASYPLFLLGVDRYLAFWREVAPQIQVAATKAGNYDNASLPELQTLIAPIVAQYFESLDQRVLDELEQAVSQKKVAITSEIASLAQAGQIAKLVIGINPNGSFAIAADVVWDVLAKAGEVEIVPAAKLGEHGAAAAILRY